MLRRIVGVVLMFQSSRFFTRGPSLLARLMNFPARDADSRVTDRF